MSVFSYLLIVSSFIVGGVVHAGDDIVVDFPRWENVAQKLIVDMSNGFTKEVADEAAEELRMKLHEEKLAQSPLFEPHRKFVVKTLVWRLGGVYKNALRAPDGEFLKKERLLKLLIEFAQAGDAVDEEPLVAGVTDNDIWLKRLVLTAINILRPLSFGRLRGCISQQLIEAMREARNLASRLSDTDNKGVSRYLDLSKLGQMPYLLQELFKAEFEYETHAAVLQREIIIFARLAEEYPRVVVPLFQVLARKAHSNQKLIARLAGRFLQDYAILKSGKIEAQFVSNQLSVINPFWEQFKSSGVFENGADGEQMLILMEKARSDGRIKFVAFQDQQDFTCSDGLTRPSVTLNIPAAVARPSDSGEASNDDGSF